MLGSFFMLSREDCRTSRKKQGRPVPKTPQGKTNCSDNVPFALTTCSVSPDLIARPDFLQFNNPTGFCGSLTVFCFLPLSRTAAFGPKFSPETDSTTPFTQAPVIVGIRITRCSEATFCCSNPRIA